MSIFTVAILACLTFIALAAGLVTLLSRNLKPVNFWLAMTSIFSGLWTLGISIFLFQTDMHAATIMARGFYAGALTIGISLYFFSRYYPSKRPMGIIESTVLCILYIGGVVYSFVPGLLIEGTHSLGTNILGFESNVVELNGFIYTYYVAVFIILVVRAILNMYFSYVDARIRKQYQVAKEIKGIMVCVSFALAGGMIFNLFMPLFGSYKLIWIGPMFAALFTIYLFYIVIRHGVLDVRAALARSIGYVVMVVVIGVIYGAVLFTVSRIFTNGVGLSAWQIVLYLALSVVIAFSVRPLQAVLDAWTYNVFYRSDYDMEEVIHEFTSVTANEIELERLSKLSLNVLIKAIRPEYVSLYVLSSSGKTYHYSKNLVKNTSTARTKNQLDTIAEVLGQLPNLVRVNDTQTVELHEAVRKTGAAIVSKLTVRDEQVGVLFIGNRENGAPYSEKDMAMLSTVIDELALAIQNGLRFDEISKFNKRLRTEINQATKELRKSNHQLQELDQIKDEFLSIASHQLRTPLTSVKGYLSMVLEGDVGKVTDGQRHMLEEAYTSSQRMVGLIEDFLNMSRLQTGRFVLDKSPTDVYTMVKNEINNLQPTANSHNLKIELDAQKDKIEKINIDENKLRQVVMNFIDNAIYYSKPDTTIHVAAYVKSKKLVIEVKDTGIGVPKGEQTRLFTKFYRATNARKRRPDGTGVGLYLAKKVVTEHGGEIIFRSTEGKGSTFGFKLPM